MPLKQVLLPSILFCAASAGCFGFDAPEPSELARWQKEAHAVNIVRDDWGIAHVSSDTDAGAVFGMIYAQAEDDFNRVETNYLNAMGRLAEAEGESKVYQDLRMKLFIAPDDLKKQYRESPAWLQALMNSFADSLNYYLYRHPDVKPRVIQKFEPWMALSFTEGSIGGDIEHINLGDLGAFYGKESAPQTAALLDNPDLEPRGSNGIAIAPANTRSHHALLLINPHTSFFFRSELQMTSKEGLNAYGAATWGQFFLYQGFNDHTGWMHTSSGVDAVDDYLETVTKQGNSFSYQYDGQQRPVTASEISVPYKTASGVKTRKFTVYRTHHGPVIAEKNGKWVSVRLMQEPIKALEQSYLRTKAHDYKSYLETMELKANSSNNTIFADSDGDIAYFHGNYISRRDTKFDWSLPVDGSIAATEWKGLLSVEEVPHLLNPASGYLFNVNNWPWSGAGKSSLKREDYPAYVENGIESARGKHAVRVLEGKKDFTLDSLIASAFDSYLPWFENTIPALVKAWEAAPASDALKTKLADQVALLRKWDLRWSADSTATSLAVFWGDELRKRAGGGARKAHQPLEDYVAANIKPDQLLAALSTASDQLAADFGSWQTRWGTINRYQRINNEIVQPFSDSAASMPVAFTSSMWGSLASFGARSYPGTKKWYGTSGNSFVAVVEFGKTVRAKAITAGGESGNPSSAHFNDEAQRYATGNLRDVYFYPSQLKGHTERKYQPGE